MSLDAVKAHYDAAPYQGGIHPYTHPEQLAALGRLNGLPAAHPRGCRVLELGCSDGKNLTEIARRWPEATCVGMDFAEEEIQRAKASAAALGNLEFIHGDLRSFQPPGGTYDYVICHGVFSWVEDEVKESILKLCSRHLAPHGLALISYNTYPGWHWRESLRQVMMMPHAEGVAGRKDAALLTLEFLGRVLDERKDPQGRFLREEVEIVRQKAQSILAHDDLGPVNEPCYFLQFAEWAAEHGLSYAGESPMMEVTPDLLPAGSLPALDSLKLRRLEYEQLIDVALQRIFRRSVVCRGGIAGELAFTPAAVRDFHFEACLEMPAGRNGKRFRHRMTKQEATVNDPLTRAMLRRLTECGKPQAFSELLESGRSEGNPGDSGELAVTFFAEAARKGLVGALVL